MSIPLTIQTFIYSTPSEKEAVNSYWQDWFVERNFRKYSVGTSISR